MTTTFSDESRLKLTEYLSSHDLAKGIGTEESACSIAAVNLAIDGKLTDTIPDCMSRVIGKWIITAQDFMPSEIRNSDRWKSLLPLAAGTGRNKESERLEIIMEWMWSALDQVQPIADRDGYGDEWQAMIKEKTTAACNYAATYATTDYVTRAAATNAAYATTYAAAADTRAARAAADAADYAAADVNRWADFDPCGLLERLINA